VIDHQDIQLALCGLLTEPNDMKTQKSIQTNSKRSVPIGATKSSGPDAHRAVEDYRTENMLPIISQPDQRLNVLLNILVGYQASLHN
jgi:hypothetical protein